MGKERFFKRKVFYLVIFLLVLSILHPLNLFGQDEDPEEILKVEAKDNLISMDVKNAALSDVLNEIEKRTGIKMTVSQELIGKKMSFHSEKLDIKKVLKEILHEYVYVFTFSQDAASKKNILKEVKVQGDVIGSKPYKGKMMTIDIPYGAGVREVGAVDEGEGAMGGPPSFAVDDIGNIYILDPLNKRIQIFSNHGGYLSSIPLKTTACDIAIDKYGSIYIYHCGDGIVKKLYQLRKDGDVVSVIDVDASKYKIYDASIYIVNDSIYIDTCDYSNACGYFLIGKIVNKLLVSPAEGERRRPTEKVYRLNGRSYKAIYRDREAAEVEITDRDNMKSKVIFIPLEGSISAEFFGADQRGNFYIKTNRSERHEDKNLVDGYRYKILTDIYEFNDDCDYIGSIQMPESDIHFRSTRNYDLGKDGTIYHFSPEKNRLQLNIFPSANN